MGERTQDAIAGIVFIILILGIEYLQIDVVGIIKPFIWVFAIFFHAYIFGKNIFPKRNWIATAFFGLILVIAVQSVAQVFWFYAGAPLGSLSDAWSLVIAIAAAHLSGITSESLLLTQSPPVPVNPPWTSKRVILSSILVLASLAAFSYVAVSAFNARTLDSIRTPWPLLDAGILPAIAVLWIAAAISAMYVRSLVLTTIHSAIALASVLCLAPLVYVLGFGFDGFLHVAGEQVLLKTGTLNPIPYYYMGEYVFITWLARIFALPLEEITRWLIPVAAVIILPMSITFAYQRFIPNYYSALILLLLPLSLLIAPTPQGLATVVGLSAVILAVGSVEKHIRITGPMWLGAWSAAIHPLAGIPLWILTMALMLRRSPALGAKAFSYILAAACGLAIPALFFLGSMYSKNLSIEWDFGQLVHAANWMDSFSKLIPWLTNKYVLWPAWSSLIGVTIPAISLILALSTFFLPLDVKRRTALFLIGAGSLMFASGLLEHTSDFSMLIQYEKGDYAERLMQIGIMILVVAAIPALSYLLEKLKNSMPIATLVVLLFIGAVGAANAHNALPRHDSVQASRGWSTGKYEIEAVRWIDRSAKNANYTVLANQAVSAAAIKEYGFKRYTPNDVFYYPIPTGGPLYEVYLKMTYEDPSIETVREAARLGESSLVYVVINDYWWKAEELNEKISQIAHEEWSIGEGKIMIYKFDFSQL